tara:strand:- start:22 stop:531 length:510 start_codon:yes stop_codon:yes gene_type:complete
MKEEFKDIPNYEGLYQVSDLGRVKSLVRKGCLTEKILRAATDGKGYLTVALSKDGKKKARTIHQLVAATFLNHKPCGHKLVVNHIDHDKLNNKLDNLELDTQRNNSDKKHLKSSSEYTGVCWDKCREKWYAQINVDGKQKYLGRFTAELEASQAYQYELKKLNNEQVSN